MYKNYFEFRTLPFENTPNPTFFFMDAQYRETLHLMVHGIVSRKGLMCVTGPIGCGKTTLAVTLEENLPNGTLIIKPPHPNITPKELMEFIAAGLGLIQPFPVRLQLLEDIKARLIEHNEAGKRCVLVLDEAHLISDRLIQEIIVLSNLETYRFKLIQIVLLGQEEILQRLSKPELKQLRQRIFAVKMLAPMGRSQIVRYIGHRMKVAGGFPEIFTQGALEAIVRFSGGIPRVINQLCDTSLYRVFSLKKAMVEDRDVKDTIAALGLEKSAGASADIFSQSAKRAARKAAAASPSSRSQPPKEPPSKADGSRTSAKSKKPEDDSDTSKTRFEVEAVLDPTASESADVRTGGNASAAANGRISRMTPDTVKTKPAAPEPQPAEATDAAPEGVSSPEGAAESKPPADCAPGSGRKPLFKRLFKDRRAPAGLIAGVLLILAAVGLYRWTAPPPDADPAQKPTAAVKIVQPPPAEPPAPAPRSPQPRAASDESPQTSREAAHAGTSGPPEPGSKPAAPPEAALPPEENSPSFQFAPPAASYPFSIFAGAYPELELAQKTLQYYREVPLPVYWVRVVFGPQNIRHRVFIGYFKDLESANAAIDAHGLKRTLAKPTRFSVYLGTHSTMARAADQAAATVPENALPYIIEDDAGMFHVYAGAYYTRLGAETLSLALKQRNIQCAAVER